MKKGLRFLIAGLLLVAAGCTDRGPLNTYLYKMVNNSGHKITLTVESRNFPAEVILQDGESYEWQNPNGTGYKGSYFEPFTFTGRENRVEYDDSYVVVFGPGVENNRRSPAWDVNYVKQKTGKHKYLYTYTFTKEDYEDTVNQLPKI